MIWADRSSRNKKMEPLTEDEILIDAVCERRPLWDNSLDAIERTKLKKNALWSEISIVMGGEYISHIYLDALNTTCADKI